MADRPLRGELVLTPAGHDASGQQSCIIHDPIRHKFFRVPLAALDQLAAPHEAKAPLAKFLDQSHLLQLPATGTPGLIGYHQQSQSTLLKRLLHGYLFFRVPLLNPEPVLDALLAIWRPFNWRLVAAALIVVAMLAVWLTTRQWDAYAAHVARALSLHGAVSFGITLAILKIFHELGHGLVARSHGCRVPVMGVAFMVMAPMLYTDVSDAWRLQDSRARLRIAAAGVAVEVGIAAVALLLWAILPGGPWRSVMFFISSTALIGSLMVNLSPFMRFDGYHMLGDALGLHNIGPRATNLMLWKLRELLFGLDELPPENLPLGLHSFLVAYAAATAIYRLSLFAGIAWLVYVMLPKAVGLPLAAVEIIFFILKPALREVSVWRQLGAGRLLASLRGKINLMILLALFAAVILPLDSHVTFPAVLLPQAEVSIYAPEPARVTGLQVHMGQHVAKGDVLLRLEVPELDYQMRQSRLRLAIIETKLARIAADARERAHVLELDNDRQAELELLHGLEARAARLIVHAPTTGTIRMVLPGLAAAPNVSRREPLLQIIAETGMRTAGLALEADAIRLEPGARARFISSDGVQQLHGLKVTNIGNPAATGVEFQYLTSLRGGPVEAGRDAQGREKPLNSVLPVELAADGPVPGMAQIGTVVAEARRVSLARLLLERLAAVTLRESGF